MLLTPAWGVAAGVYLPLTAVLGGLLFVQPEGYEEARRDVIRLSADVDALVAQQGYITCDPLDPLEGGPMEPHPLHCSLLVIPAQVLHASCSWYFQCKGMQSCSHQVSLASAQCMSCLFW